MGVGGVSGIVLGVPACVWNVGWPSPSLGVACRWKGVVVATLVGGFVRSDWGFKRPMFPSSRKQSALGAWVRLKLFRENVV